MLLSRMTADYSLSRNYQVSENVFVTCYLIVPLDLCNTAIYIVFLALSTWIRTLRNVIADHTYSAIYEWIYAVSTGLSFH